MAWRLRRLETVRSVGTGMARKISRSSTTMFIVKSSSATSGAAAEPLAMTFKFSVIVH